MSAEEVAKRENHDKKWLEFVKLRRCDSPSRGSIYDSSAGVTCHFCRQKKLCGEGNCGRCSTRDPSVDCIGVCIADDGIVVATHNNERSLHLILHVSQSSSCSCFRCNICLS